jgi:hypothetical protein
MGMKRSEPRRLNLAVGCAVLCLSVTSANSSVPASDERYRATTRDVSLLNTSMMAALDATLDAPMTSAQREAAYREELRTARALAPVYRTFMTEVLAHCPACRDRAHLLKQLLGDLSFEVEQPLLELVSIQLQRPLTMEERDQLRQASRSLRQQGEALTGRLCAALSAQLRVPASQIYGSLRRARIDVEGLTPGTAPAR